MLAPAGTSPEIIARMSAEVTRIVRSPEVSASLQAQAFRPVGGPPRQLKTYIDNGLSQSAEVIKSAGIKLD
jgi:tripartite-type tricarboxylate transporter receptor subunit TctC